MTVKEMKRAFDVLEFIEVEDYFVYRDGEVFNTTTLESRYYDSVDKMMYANINGKSLEEAIAPITFEEVDNG